MDIFDSESLTPPGSPILGYSGLRGTSSLGQQNSNFSKTSGSLPVYCFSCKGPLRAQDKSFSSDGFFLRSEVIRVIKRFGAQSVSLDDRVGVHLVTFFGHRFDPTDKTQLKILVRMCRENIYTLETMAHPSFSFGLMGVNGGRNILYDDEVRSCPFKLRSNVCSFLNYIAARCVPLTLFEAQDLFGGLRKALERPKSWSSSLQCHCGSKEGNECTSSEYHLFHLQLELRWSLLLIFQLSQSVLNWVLEDLLYLAYVKYTNSESNLLEKNPYNCYCVKELWAMIRNVVVQLKPNGRDFWDLVTTALSKLNNESDLIFPLWLLSNLVTLNEYGINGVYTPVSCNNQRDKLENSNTCYTMINQVLKEWVHRGGKTFEVTELVYRLLPYWGYDLDVTLTLWNLWLPKIDKGFEVRSVEPYSSAKNWLQLISTIVNSSHESEFPPSEISEDCKFSNDPFLAFLRLLCAHVKLSSTKDWRKLKSNICNRLPQKTVNGFSENGLTRVATLFLALIFVTDDSESMCERLNETLSYGKDSFAVPKLRARCVMILLLLQKSIHVSNISSYVMRTVNEIMGMSVSGRTPTHKDLVMTYVDFLENVPNFNGHLNLGQSELISLNLTMWLSTCGPNYVNRTLRVLHIILDTWILDTSSIPTSEKDTVALIIQDKTEQFLKQTVVSSQNRNPEFDIQPLADLAVDLTILQHSKKNSVAVGSLYEMFALNSNTSPIVSEIFIDKIVNSAIVLDMYSVITENQLIQSWIRLITLGRAVPPRLTVRVLGGSEISYTGGSENRETTLGQFCSTASAPGSGWTSSRLHILISPALDALKATRAKSFDNVGAVDGIVKSVVILFKNLKFSNIYIRNNQASFVHQVLEVSCPNFVGNPPWEKLPDALKRALTKYLPDIFVAISFFEPWLQDPYLKRKMSDLVRFALLGFATGEELEETNPALKIMKHCECLQGRGRDLIMQEIATSIYTLAKDDQIAKRFLLVYVGFLTRRMMSTVVHLLGSVMDLLVERNELAHRCRNIVLLTWSSVLGRESCSYLKPVLLVSLDATMKKHFAFRSDRFFELFSGLAASTQHRNLIRKFLSVHVIPILIDQITISESKQGSGTNYKLRGSLRKLEEELQN